MYFLSMFPVPYFWTPSPAWFACSLAQHCTLQHYTAIQCKMHNTSLKRLSNTALQCTPLPQSTQNCYTTHTTTLWCNNTTLHNIALHTMCNAQQCTTLHNFTLQFTILHNHAQQNTSRLHCTTKNGFLVHYYHLYVSAYSQLRHKNRKPF